DDAVARLDVRSLMNQVHVRDDGEPMQFPIGGVAEVRVAGGEGERTARVETPRGDPTNPLSWDDLASKFRDCAGLALPPNRVETLIGLLSHLEELPDIRELAATC